ncbi:NAD(P)/FAD-dependent oxidoreductase [Saccharopolyspora sp. ASAGF58]|uniref:flavin-containing monooxygenase n=1 Tax=Saccharopolyspora sp. ASAGF58 TaxID=2719023 RepID=UPI0014400224|nr:NAD(P)/FAD-dependent oxidoreductase [Saccharopolyspora sp. ASAGF58]QIZ37980.1 NAD(P)/FAD-dependent oxidoreductase [Saccharopolyspora sp. ASAGF58]
MATPDITTDPATTGGDAREIAANWLTELDDAVGRRDVAAIETLLIDEVWWRDLLALTWDIRTFRGRAAIGSMLTEYLDTASPSGFVVEDGTTPTLTEFAGRRTVEAFFTFTTRLAHGRGVLRLVPDGDRWRAWTVLTSMQDIKGHEEKSTSIADVAFDQYNTAVKDRPTWYETRAREREFADSEPTVVIVGAGHSGLMLAARLQKLGVSHLVVDQEERLGDNWRRRYSGLSLHDTSWFSRFPYLEYPANWPLYTPAEMMGDFIESYVNLMQLNAWVRTTVTAASFDEAVGEWTVTVDREGTPRELHPRHLVFATGMAGKPKVPSVPGEDRFRGEILHSSAFPGGKFYPGKNAVVVGVGSSGHDVAQSLYEGRADAVTLVQRSGAYVMSGKNGIPVFHGQLWTENGPALDEADLISVSLPWEFQLEELVPGATRLIAEADRELIDGLTKAGFEVDLGAAHVGMLGAALNGTSGYYIDKGCSQLIIDGEVRLQRGEITEFTETGVVYSDGTAEETDLVVFATGWENARETARAICGDEVADRVSLVWGLGEDGELRGTFRRSGYPNLWFVVGSTGVVRGLSKHVALQILGSDLGLLPTGTPSE